MNGDILTFRRTMGQFPTGVTVVTTVRDGEYFGLTVNSFTSISLEPLEILVCLSRSSATHAHIEETGMYAVSILEESQRMIATIFAGAPMVDRFKDVAVTRAPSGCPVIAGAIAWLDARVVRTLDSGDHTLFIAEVTGMHINDEHARPLLYHRGSYARLAVTGNEPGSA